MFFADVFVYIYIYAYIYISKYLYKHISFMLISTGGWRETGSGEVVGR